MWTNPYAEVTGKILDQLKAGAAPWVKPWKSTKGAPVGMPHNAQSGRSYSGANVFMLWIACTMHPEWWDQPGFVTFKQALDLGGNVRKGEKGEPVYYMGKFNRSEENAEGEEEKRQVSFLKRYTVFHVSQCEGLPERLAAPQTVSEPLLEGSMAEFYACLDADVRHGGNRAFYRPSGDVIYLPEFEAFESEAAYHATRLHETMHWTGAPARLDRKLRSTTFGNKAYAFEELVAELGAALLCAELEVEGQLRHADYIANWITLLEDHDRAFFSAASQASKAVEFVRGQCLAERGEAVATA